MITVTDEVLNGEPVFNIYDSNNNLLYSNVSIELATTINVEGTPINKALFTSINDDINTKLNTSSKSTTAQAQAGSNDTNYMTPSKTNSFYTYRKSTTAQAQAGSDDTNFMTPSKTNSFYTYRKATQTQAETGTDDTNFMTALQVKNAFNNYGKPSDNMSIVTGTISHNGTIPQTSGYTNHLYLVSMNNASVESAVDGSIDTKYGTSISCSVNQSTRKVTCQIGFYRYVSASSSYTGWTYSNGTANYIEIAWN